MSWRSHSWLSVSLVFVLGTSSVFAEGHGQGQGHGLNRALAAAARGSSSSGLARAGQNVARSGNGFSHSGTNLGRSANGLNRAANGMSHNQALNSQAANATRIRDQRLKQADHLREVSTKNGNERLLDTADRMQRSALTNYDRRIGGSSLLSEDNLTRQNAGHDVASRDHVPTPPTQPTKNPRTSWLPKWLGLSR